LFMNAGFLIAIRVLRCEGYWFRKWKRSVETGDQQFSSRQVLKP
jgi:hypothetical protein